MIQRKIKALRDFTLNTYYESYFLVEGEVKSVVFKNQRMYEDHLSSDNFIPAKPDEEEVKSIPVVLPESVELEEEVKPIEPEKEELPFIEAIQPVDAPVEEQDKEERKFYHDEVTDDNHGE